jgi:protein involved in sex pheromone biosynthesis
VVLLALLVGLAATSVMYFRSERERNAKTEALAQKDQALKEREAVLASSEGLRLAAQEALGEARSSMAKLFLAQSERSITDGSYQRAALFAAASLDTLETEEAWQTLRRARAEW